MNKKLIKASIAGAAAIALAAGGGGTFAAWSDFGVEETGAGAGILKLQVSDRDGSGSNIQPFNLAPGQNKYQEFFLASADGANVPDGVLTAKIINLVDQEDGTSCTTNSEAVAEGSALDGAGLPTDMGICQSDGAGELSEQAAVQILISDPVADQSSCPNTGIYHSATPSGTGLLNAQPAKTFQLGTLNPGEGVCVRMEMSLPTGATNASQGDTVDFDWRFDLVQAP